MALDQHAMCTQCTWVQGITENFEVVQNIFGLYGNNILKQYTFSTLHL